MSKSAFFASILAAIAAAFLSAAAAFAVAPVVSQAIPDTTVAEGSPTIHRYRDLNRVFFDTEDGDSLAFAIVGNSNPSLVFASIDADSALDLGFAPNASGTSTLIIRATDSEAFFVEETFVVTVHPTLWLVKADGSGDEPTIQAAVNAAFDGDTILLSDGVFRGGGNTGIDLGGKDILLTSENGPEAAIIDAEGNDRVFLLDDTGPGCVLSNVTIRNAQKNQGAGIKMSRASPVISGVVFEGNSSGRNGGAIWCDTGSSPTITGCVFIANSAGENGGAIYSVSASPVIENCTIVESSAGSGGAGIHLVSSGGSISNTIISFSTQGPGMACISGTSVTVSCTDIYGNTGGDSYCGADGGGNFSADPLFCAPQGSGNVSISGASPCDPARNSCGVLIGALPAACGVGPRLDDTPNTVYPSVAFPGEPEFVIHIGLNNLSDRGVMLSKTSTVVFSDSTRSYASTLANSTYVPGYAKNFTVTFSSAVVPADIQAPASYGLELNLSGVDDSSEVYGESIKTSRTNSILVDTPKIVVSASPLPVASAIPGSRDIPILALHFKNGYADERRLDSLTVANMTYGPGGSVELDAEAERLLLYDDTDASGDLSAPDVLVAVSAFVSGRAVFAAGGGWSLSGLSDRNLIIAADIDSMLSRDGDKIDTALLSPADIVFQGNTRTNEDFSPLYPLDSFGYVVVNGMARHQIGFLPSPGDTLFGDARDVPVLELVIPPNGYETDTLTALSIRNYAPDFSVSDIAAMRLYRDDGNGIFDPAVDTGLGGLVFSGDRYQISGLLENISAAARFFVAVDAAPRAVDGHHFRPGIPLEGIQVASGNDGPVDTPATSVKSFVFENPEVIEIGNLSFPAGPAPVGSRDARLLFLSVKNRTLQPVTLDSLTLANASGGIGGPADLDATFSALRIYKDDGDGAVGPGDAVVADGLAFASGSMKAGGLGIDIGIDETAYLLVTADVDSFCAADGDTLRVRLNGPGDVVFAGSHTLTGSFPAVTPATVRVDGMRAYQIALYPASDTLVVSGGAHVLLLDFGIPSNGYAADALQTLVVRNEGTATSEHFDRIALYADGGNGLYDHGAGDDTFLGNFVDDPADPEKSFLIAGLSLSLTPPCGSHTRVFVSADIAESYSVAGTIRFSIPVMGLRVASGNDGPTDVPVVEPSLKLIPKPDRLTVFPYAVGDKVVYPGSAGNLNTGVGFYNGYTTPLTLSGIHLYQVGTASSAEIDSVFLHADSNTNGLFDPASDARIASTGSTGPSFAFDGMNVVLEPRKITYLFVTYDLPLAVTDAATVDMRLFGPADITVEPFGAVVEGDFPVNSPGTDTIDGMIAAQIGVGYVPPFNASPNNADIPALTLVLPPNGIWPDALDFISVENEGTALGGRDIASVRLWKEAGGDPARFDPGMEDPIDYLDWTGSRWTNSSPLGIPIPVTGLRVHVTFTAAASPMDGVTVRLRVPTGGVEVSSANDGPIDAPVRGPNQQTISTDPLVATLLSDRLSYSVGQTIDLSLVTRNEGIDTLYGVHPSAASFSGTGNASLVSPAGPVSADLAPGSSVSFVWRYTADTAGDIVFCARAWSGDSLVVSEETCTETALIQNRPTGVTLSLANLAPAAANRAQDDVRLFRINAGYASADPLGATVELGEVRVGFKNAAGAPIAPNSVLDRVVFEDPSGPDRAFSIADSTNPVLRLVFPQPVALPPGKAVSLEVTCDISATAVFTPFSLEFQTPADIGLTDANDGTAVSVTTPNSFPWSTTAIAVNVPAETLLVDSRSGAPLAANAGQENLRVFSVAFSNPGDPTSALVILTDLRLRCFDLSGVPIQPESVVRRLRVSNGGSILYDDDVVAEPSGGLAVTLATPLVVASGSLQTLDFDIDLKTVPAADGFYFVLEDPGSVIARDINTAELVWVGAADPVTRDFPFESDRVTLQNPAAGIAAAFDDRLPAVLLPSSRNTPVMDVVVSHAGSLDASSVRVDSLAFDFSFADGAPAFPGDYFGRLVVVHDGDTVGVVSPGSASPRAECRLSEPVTMAPQTAGTLSVFADTKPRISPARIQIRLEQEGLVARDVNDGTRIYGIAGEFPFVAGPASIEIPTELVSALVVSRVPPNISGSETNLEGFDLVLENGRSQGYTAVELRSIRISIQGEKGSAIDPARVAGASRLVTPDSTVIDGVPGASGIDYTLPAGLFAVASGTRDTLSFFFDIDTDLADKSFRFAIEDSSMMEAVDAVSGAKIRVGTIGGVGYPLATLWTHVLGRGAEAGYTNYPNPFAAGREQTAITYYLDRKSRVSLKLYTIWGAPVATLVDNKTRDPGLHQDVRWDGRNGDGDVVANGVYYLLLEVREEDGKTFTLKRKVGVVR